MLLFCTNLYVQNFMVDDHVTTDTKYSISADRLKNFIERIERLEEEK